MTQIMNLLNSADCQVKKHKKDCKAEILSTGFLLSYVEMKWALLLQIDSSINLRLHSHFPVSKPH